MSKQIHITLKKEIFDVQMDNKNYEVHVETTSSGREVSDIFGEEGEVSNETKNKLEGIVLNLS